MLFKPSKQMKAQSAMEYLMTYGWAILIIAVVLGALFSLGVFSGSNLLGSACVAGSGYLCQAPIYSHANSYIGVTVGQNTGTSWTSANFLFVPSGTSTLAGVPSVIGAGAAFQTAPANDLASLTTGQSLQIWLGVNSLGLGLGNTITVGTPATGAIWVAYTTASAPSTLQYAQIASINIKAS